MSYNGALLACQSACMFKEGMGDRACMRQCMDTYGYRYAAGGKKKSKTKKGNKRRKNKRTIRKRVK